MLQHKGMTTFEYIRWKEDRTTASRIKKQKTKEKKAQEQAEREERKRLEKEKKTQEITPKADFTDDDDLFKPNKVQDPTETASVAVINPSLEVPGHLNINKQDTNLSEEFGPTPGGKRFSIISEELKVGDHNEHNDSRFTISSPANANVQKQVSGLRVLSEQSTQPNDPTRGFVSRLGRSRENSQGSKKNNSFKKHIRSCFGMCFLGKRTKPKKEQPMDPIEEEVYEESIEELSDNQLPMEIEKLD